jgi:PAS domain S-box-containing protein
LRLLTASGVGVWERHVPSGRIERNEACPRLTHITVDELNRGLASWSERVHPDDRQEVLEKRRRLLAGDLDAYTADYRVRREGGGWATLRGFVGVTDRDPTGRPLHIGGVVLDVSAELYRARWSQTLFERPFQYLGLLTTGGNVIELNRSMLQLAQHTAQQVAGKPLWELPPFDSTPQLQRQVRQGVERAAAGDLVRMEIVDRSSRRSPVAMDLTLTPLRDTDGDVVHIIPEGKDLSELMRTRDALHVAEERLRTTTDAGNVGLWEARFPECSLWVSERWWALLGYVGRGETCDLATLEALVHPDDRSRVFEAMDAARRGDIQEMEYEARLRCRDGTWRWIAGRGQAVECAEDGAVRRICGVHLDIQERKEAQLHLIAADRLESVGRLAAGVAHEINTPVQYVNDSLYFIREGVEELLRHGAAPVHGGEATAGRRAEPASDLQYLADNLPAACERAVDGVGRIAEIVQSLKEFAHADPEAMCPVDLRRVIGNTLVVARSEYKYIARLTTDLADVPDVPCHATLISQVVLNLIVNAAHAIADSTRPAGELGTITVRTYQEGDRVVIAVADTGCGIPEPVRHRIFDPFFTTKEVGRGTGLGLSFVHNVVVKVHGGSVSFQTECGRGTTFCVRLPLQRDSDTQRVAAA